MSSPIVMVSICCPNVSVHMVSKCSWPSIRHVFIRRSDPHDIPIHRVSLWISSPSDISSLRCQLVSQTWWCPYGIRILLMSLSFWSSYDISLHPVSLYFSGCGGDFSGKNGSIISPNYPSSFPAFSDCVWRIKAPVGRYISLRFQEFTGINGINSECLVDSIELKEGHSSEAPLIGMQSECSCHAATP